MSVTPWVSRLNPISDGEEVRARIANRLPGQLTQRTQYLKDLLDLMEAYSGIYARNVALDSAVLVGQPVYWDELNLRYAQAKAAVAMDTTVGGFTLAKSSYVVGICAAKSGSTRGDVIMKGLLPLDTTNAIGSSGETADEAGPYYLSGTEAGKLSKQKPPVGIYCAYLRGDGYVHVDPAPREVLESHVHYVFDLFATPAGELVTPAVDTPYEFSTSSDLLPGWLPADDPSFNGLAPVGAVFGYNLKAHPELQLVWPPLPTNNAYIEMNGLGLTSDTVRVDVNGIWWFVNCYGKAPWPNVIPPTPSSSSSSSLSSSSSSSSSGAPTCDSGVTLEQMGFLYRDPASRAIRLYFAKMVFKTNNALVTSLRAATGSPIVVTGCGGAPASTGDLCLGLNLALSMQENTAGYKALKSVSGTTFQRGPIVEGIVPGTDLTAEIVSGEVVDGVYYGKVRLTPNIPGRSVLDVGIDLVSLDSVREEQLNGVFYLSMPQDRASIMTGRVLIPDSLLVTTPQIQFWFMLLSRAAGTTPTIGVEVAQLPKTEDCTEKTLADYPFASIGALDVCTFTAAGKYVRVTAPAVTVVAGDTLFFRLTRPGYGNAGDAYAADLGVLRMGAIITTAP